MSGEMEGRASGTEVRHQIDLIKEPASLPSRCSRDSHPCHVELSLDEL